MSKTAATREEWLALCPLKIWLDKKGRGARAQFARDLDVDVSTLGYWMRGASEPNIRSMAAIHKHTGITLQSWVGWLNAFPKE